MRLLYLADPGYDFLQDLVFHGLSQLLGDDVVEWPPNERYRGAPPPDAPFPFLHFGLRAHPGGSLEEHLASADAIVAASLRDGVRADVRRALELRPRGPWAFVDGEDDPYVRGIVRSVDVYFKREVLLRAPRLRARMPLRRRYHDLRGHEHWRDPLRRQVAVATPRAGVVPLPLAILAGPPPPRREDRYDVAFLARPTSLQRARIAEGLVRLASEGLRVCEPDRELPWREYVDVLASSRIGISVRGLGYDTQRYWEIPHAGAMLLAENPRTVIPENFVPEVEAVFGDPRRLTDQVTRLLEAGTSDIAAQGQEKVLREHTSVRRAEVVLERLDSTGRG